MPWFPNFINAAELARRQTRADDRADPPAAYVTALERRTARDLESTWPGEVVIHDPRGTIRGHREVKHFVRRNGEWLAGLHARTETIAATTSGGRAVLELLAHLTWDGREVAWPVAVVAETGDDRSVEFRTYCSQRPVTGTHHLRPPVLPPSSTARRPTTARGAPSSTTACAGATTTSLPRQGSWSASATTRAGWPPCASTTTSRRR